ncbi:MAG: cellulose biosynthesis cyclic di-GMP-binding regulatory protein BcsB, partial [Kofleriaceae bacterium]|nr:cellulose biosynthesis cyclic di-GMP-binding regulatory protein BcsB [Kofleriaceae bacterium]
MIVALLIALGIAGAANTAPIVHTPFDRPIVLSGRSSSVATNITVDSDKGDIVLNLVWSTSDIVDRENSLITILLDQQPIRTSRLNVGEKNVNQRWRISLGKLEPGPHQITLKTHLEVAGDPCLNRFANEAWFRIESKTSIELPAKTGKVTETGLREFPSLWQGNDRL